MRGPDVSGVSGGWGPVLLLLFASCEVSGGEQPRANRRPPPKKAADFRGKLPAVQWGKKGKLFRKTKISIAILRGLYYVCFSYVFTQAGAARLFL